MTLPILDELYLPYLSEHPPTHILVAAYLGFKPGKAVSITADPLSSLGELGAGSGMAAGDVHAGLGASVLNFDKLKMSYRRG